MIGVGEDEGNDQRVGDDRRNGAEKTVLAKCIGADRAKEGRQRSEDDIRQGAARHNVADQAPQCKAGDGRRRKKGQDGERLGKTDLNGAACKVKTCGDHGQYGVGRGDQGRLCDIKRLIGIGQIVLRIQYVLLSLDPILLCTV